MTRDEAIAESVRCRAGDANRTANQVKAMHLNAGRRIDSYVALGMLTLDEPKSPEERLAGALESTNIRDSVGTVLRAIEAAGLKIVDK